MYIDKNVDIETLLPEIQQAGLPITALRFLANADLTPGGELRTDDPQGVARDFTPEEQVIVLPVVEAHVPPPKPFDYALATTVDAVLTTTDDLEHDVFVLPAQPRSIYRAELTMSAMDRGNGAMKTMTGILVWKRLLGANVIAPPSNITVLSQINDTAAASWIMNGVPQAGNFRVYVKGAPGRTIDWFLTGPIGRFAPGGLDV